MKKLIFYVLITLCVFNSYSQSVETIGQAPTALSGLTVHGDYVYVASWTDNRIFKLDYTIDDAPFETISIMGNNTKGVAVNNNCLYVTNNADGMFKIDLSDNTPLYDGFGCLLGAGTMNGITIENDILYVSYNTSVYKVTNINGGTPTFTEIISDLDVSMYGTMGLCAVDDYLYVSASNLLKYDLTGEPLQLTSEVIVDIEFLSITENNGLIYGVKQDSIHVVDVSSKLSAVLPFEIFLAYNIFYHEDKLFVSGFEGGEVHIVDLLDLSIKSKKINSINIYPNPVTSELYLDDIEIGLSIDIITPSGKNIYSSKVRNKNLHLNLDDYETGTYIIKVTDYETKSYSYKIIKE